MSEMLHRVAEQIETLLKIGPLFTDEKVRVEMAESIARHIIGKMWEPTEEMIEAAKGERLKWPEGTPPGIALRRIYQAMLAAAQQTTDPAVSSKPVEPIEVLNEG